MKKITLGIIGTGTIAQVAHLPNIAKIQEFELLGACDKQRARLNGVADKYSIAVRDTNYETFLNRDDIDAVLISTPNDSHHDIAVTALQAGKHVLIEKPLARTIEEVESIANAAKAAKTVLMVGMNHRFRLDLVALKNMISHKQLGSVYAINAGWLNHQSTYQHWSRRKDRAGGGVMMDLGLVMVDVISWLLDFPSFQTVSSVMVHNKTTSVEDTALCFLRTDSGAAVHINVSWTSVTEKSDYYLDVFGTEGSASVNPLRIHKTMAETPVNVTPVLKGSASSIYQRSYVHELRHFAGAINGTYPIVSTAEEALHRMRIIHAAYQSAKLNQEISLT